MVAIVTGNALGLSTGSLADLGQQGAKGSAAVGRNGDSAYVNAATGNLVLQTQDELLVGRGLSIESLRTYNSRGLFNDDNGDNWSMGVYAQQLKKVETSPYSGVFRFVRTGRDGAEATYLYAYGTVYQSTAGEGAYDRVLDNGTSWVWVDGSTGLQETYDVNTGRLMTVVDRSGNTLTYTYNGTGQLTSVIDANGEQTFYDYVGNQLRQVRTGFFKNDQFVSQTRVRYEYDTSYNRLWKVTVDLTPEDNSVSDGKTFVTTYGYDGASKRVSSITHNNDTVLRLQYDTSGRVQYAYDAFDKRTEYRYEATGRTRVIDAVGAETVYEYFSTGELKSISTVAGGNVLETIGYQYEVNGSGFSTGNVVRVTDGQNNVTSFVYDGVGNRVSEIDTAGYTVTRAYSGGNQVQSEIRYLEQNGWGQPGAHLTTRYVYDEAGLNRLRFVISPEGRVTEYRYDSYGQRIASLTYGTMQYPVVMYSSMMTIPTESSMASWASQTISLTAYNGTAKVQRVDMSYDARGQLSKTVAYSALRIYDYSAAGVLDGNESITHFVYDQAGNLLQTVSPTGGVTAIAYDGLGRMISRTEANGTTTISTYSDASNVVEQTITQTGLKTTTVYDKAGRVVSVQQTNAAELGLGETKYAYDGNGRLLMTTDPAGLRQWMLYDEAGRRVADIDGNGTLVEYSYNRSGQLTRTAAYATAVNTAALVDGMGKPTAPALSALRPAAKTTDVYQWRAYDKAGRLVKTVNAEGAVSETFYDGADRVVKVTQYASRISTAGLTVAPTPESITPALDATRDRATRYFYDTDGLLLAELDAEGYVTEYRYNVAGQRNWTLRYTNPVDPAYRATGNFYTVAQYPFYSGAPRTSTLYYYNNKGQVIAEVDAENYLTEFAYDKNGNVIRRERYNPPLSTAGLGALTPTSVLDFYKNTWQRSSGQEKQLTTWQYDQFNRVTLMTEPDGTVTKYDYDAVGNLVRTTRAYGQGTEERAVNARYDAQGRLVAELAATEAWRLTTGMTDAQMATVFEQYGVKHSYDKAGRRTSTSDRNGLTTLYFYNEDSQLTHSVNAMGEVEERRYNALGQLEATLHYGLRLDSSTRSQLRSGTTSIASAVAAIADAAKDSKTTFDYKLSGLVASSTELLKVGTQAVVQHLYDAFGGEIERRTDLGDGTGRVRLDTMGYDRRGLQTRSTVDAGGAAIDTTVEYDAFGRVIKTWDDAGKLSETGYDKLGRVIRTLDRHGYQHGTLYDAFDRVLTQSDPLGKVTTYTHNTAARSVTMVTPENISVTTVYNRHGQTLSITDGKLQTTSYTYDKDGNLTRTTAPIASASTNQTFERGRLIEAFDANDTKVKYTYDDANRVLSRELDPDGLKLLTKYEYDSGGRQIKVTDPAGVVTRVEYDLAGRQVAQTVDEGAGRLNLRTEYTHDASGNVLTVTSPGGRVTQYKYDALGRRTEEIVDPAGLALRTVYTFDHDGNVRTRTDANGAVSGFAYDAEGWLQYSVDGAGGVTYYEYDKNGRVTRTTRYAKAISIVGLTAQFTSADIAARVVSSPGKDAIEARSYDGDGRLRFSVDGNGAVVEYRYDKNSNVNERIAYAKAINVAAWTSGNPPVVTSTSDQRLRSEYDALNRLTYQADATGAVTRREYDDNGNLRRLTEYATKLTGTQTPGQVAGNAGDRVSVFVYDKANRETWRVDATGAAQKSDYDNDGNLIARTSYFRTITAGTEPTSVAVHSQDRTERYRYDGAGRRTHGVDALNYVTRWSYNDALNTRTVTRFATAINTGADPTAVTVNTSFDQTDLYVDDKAGRLSSHTDALGQTESYTYDGLGNKKTFTNKKGSVWQYEYDAASRLIRETSPEVYLTEVVVGTGGKLQQGTSADVALKTFLEYDALGNLLRRTEAEGRPEQRTTSYDYDARGRQTKVTYPPVMLYGEATERSLTAQTFYDALGNAVANIDVAGKTSYKVYDLAGRVRYEVDTVGHVTGYERTTFGEAQKVIRYWKPTNLPTQTTAAAVASLPSEDALLAVQTAVTALDHSRDRSITNSYDKLGRVIEVREATVYTFDSASVTSTQDAKKTSNTYNAFGEVVKTRVSGDTGNAAIDTYFYYDRLGHQVAQVDALGHVTAREFDATGNMTASTEYAGKLDPGGWNAEAYGLPLPTADDRKTTWSYDRLNRKVTETRVGVSFAANAASIPAGQPATANIVTRFGYDALGNLTSTLDANGGKVLSYYDALGRVTAVASPATQGVNGTVTPLSIFLRDAYGNVAVKLDMANGAAQAEEFTGVSRATAAGFTMGAYDSAKDRRTVTQYDKMGRAVQTTDAMEHSQFSAYLANGQVGKTWQSFTDIDNQTGTLYQVFEYDELGRLVRTREPAPTNLLGTAGGAETRTEVSYNAFGEITERRVDGTLVEFFEYDDVGQLWRTNSGDGITRVMFYDVHGRATAEVRSRGADFGNVDLKTDFSSAEAVKNAVVANHDGLRYTLTQYDALGRVTMQTQPVRTENQSGVVMRTHSGATAVVNPTVAPGAVQPINLARLSWESLESLGAGEVRVELTYKSVVSSGGLEPTFQTRTSTLSQVFGAEQSAKGVDFGWNNQLETLQEVQNFSVWKKDAAGVYRLILDRAIGSKSYSVEVALPPDPAAGVRFETKVGNGNWIPQTSGIRFGSVLRFDLAQLGSSGFSYQVFYDRLDPQTGLPKSEAGATGQFTITGAPVLQPIDLAGGFQMPGVAEGVLAWTKPPAGTTQVLNYRPIGGTWRTVDTVYDVSATLSGANAAGLLDGEYEYELLWTPSGQPLPTSHSTGTFKVTAAVTEQQTTGKPNVTGILVTALAVTWDSQIGGTAIAGTPRFEWRLKNENTWQAISPITTANNRSSVDISTLGGGAYEFRISYELNGAQTALGTVDVSLAEPDPTDAPDAIVSNRVTSLASGFEVDATGTILSWSNRHIYPKFEYRERGADGQSGDGPWTVLATYRGRVTTNVNISGLPGGKQYEFRITSEEADNATVTIGAGNLTTYIAGAGIPQPPQVSSTAAPAVTGLQVVGQELSWNQIAGTRVEVEGRYAGSSVWRSLDYLTTPDGGKVRLDMSTVEPGDYQVRISHYNGDALVAFDARSVKVYPNPSAAPYFINHTPGRAITAFTVAADSLAWDRPVFVTPGTARFEYLDPADQSQTWHERAVVTSGATDRVLTAGLPANYLVRVTYREGILVVGGGAASVGPGTIGPVPTVAIGGLSVSEGRLRWNAPTSPLTTKVFMRVDGVFKDLAGVELANNQSSIAIPARTATFESYEYLIQYRDANGETVAVGAATVELSPASVRADPVAFALSNTRITNITADRLTMSWDVRAGTPKVEARLLNSGSAWEAVALLQRATGSLRESVSVAGFNANYEWRITYTDADAGGGIAAIEYGTINVTSPTPVLTNLTSSQLTGFTVAPGRMSWVKPAGTTSLSVKLQDPRTGTWVELPSDMFFAEGGLQAVDLSHAGADTVQVLITYFTGSDITHVMRGTVTTPVAGSVIPTNTAVAVDPPTTSQFSWADVPGAGAPVFQYRLRNTADWRTDLPVSEPVDGKRHVDINSLDGSYEYRVSYSASGSVKALATGQLDIVRPKPELSALDGAVLKNMNANTTRWSWDKPAVGTGIAKYRVANGPWSGDFPVRADGSRDYLDLVDATPGSYEYVITYTEGGVATSFSTGSFVVLPPTLASADRADIQGLTQSPARLTWNQNAAGAAKFAYRTLNATGDWTSINVQTNDGKAFVDLTGLHGPYNYRISYEMQDGSLVALDTGRLDIATTAPTLPTQGDSKLQGLEATRTQLRWLARAGTLKVEYRVGTADYAAVGDAVLIRGVGGYDAVDLSRFGALDGDFRITYTNDGLVTQIAMGTIQGPGWTAPVPNPSANITGVTVSGTTLTWTSTHIGTAQFFYRVSGGTWLPGAQPSGSSVSIASLVNSTATYEYRIVYADGAGMTALGMGRLTTTAATASLGGNAGGKVEGFQIDRRQVSWATPSGASGAPVVHVRQAAGIWDGPMELLGQNAFDVSRFRTNGNWEVRVAYSNGGQLTHLGIASFTLNSPAVSGQTVSEITGITGAAGPKLVWNAMSVGTPKLTYFDSASATWRSAADAGIGTLVANDGTGRASFNFTKQPPSTYQFQITYELSPTDIKSFASGQIQFNGDTAAPTVSKQTDSFFGASIVAGLGELRWTRPSAVPADGFYGVAEYRVAGSNSTWSTPALTIQKRSNDTHFVDISSVGPGNYEFRIVYANVAGVVAGARPTVQIYAAPATVSQALASLGSFTLAGTQLSWTAPASGGTAVFEYLNGGNWIADRAVSNFNGNPSVNVQGIYGSPVNFRVRYTSGGYDVAFGSGSFNASPASQPGHTVLASDVSDHRIEFGKLLWTRPASGGTGTFWWRPSTGGGWLSAAASESFDLANLASGSWSYRVTYSNGGVDTSFGSGTLTVPTSAFTPITTRADIGPVTAPPNGTTLEWAPSVVAGATATFKVKNNDVWEGRDVTTVNGKHSASVLGFGGTRAFRIEYTLNGQVVGLLTGTFTAGSTGVPQVGDTSRGEVEGVSMLGNTLSWTRPAAGGTVNVYTRRVSPQTPWEEKPVVGETASLASLSNDQHEFRIVYRDANQVITAMAMGNLLPQGAQVTPAATTNVGGFEVSRTRLSWDKPALTGVTEEFWYFDEPTQGWYRHQPFDAGSNRRAIDVTGLENVSYRYRVLYKDTATGDLKALGTGTFSVGASTAPVLTPVVSTISQPVLQAGRLVWERPPSAPAGSTVRFEYLLQGGSWTSAGVSVTAHDGTHDRIELSALPAAGTYEWRVKYLKPGTTFVLAIGSGSLVVPPSIVLSDQALGNVTGIRTDSLSLSWDPMPPSAGTARAEVFDVATQLWHDVSDDIKPDVNGRPSVRIAGAVGDHDFRISYGIVVDGTRQVMALGRGRFTGTAGTVTHAVTASPVGSFEAADGILSWTPGSGPVEVHRRSMAATTWQLISPVNTNGSRHSLSIGDIDAGDYEYRVVYKDGENVTAMARIGVTVHVGVAWPQPPAELKPEAAAITDFTVPANSHDIRWTRSTGTAAFEYRRQGTAEWLAAPVGSFGTQDGVDVRGLDLPQGGYEFRVQYRSGQGPGTVVQANGAGKFTVPARLAGTQAPTLQLNTAPAVLGGFTSTPTSVRWNAPANSVGQKVFVEARLVTDTGWAPVDATRGGTTDGVSFEFVKKASSYEFRVTYTDGAGVVTALGSGVVTFGDATVVRTTPTAEITTPPYVPGHPAAPASYVLTSNTTATTPHAISDPRLGYTAQHAGGVYSADYALRPKIVQKLDRWGNVIETSDPRNANWKTTYKWNWANQLVEQARPVDGSSGAQPTTRIYYDAMGRQVGIRDANGNLNRQVYDQAGNLIDEWHADEGHVTHRYDALGNKVQTIDAVGNEAQRMTGGVDERETAEQAAARRLGRTTDFSYDRMGRLLEAKHGGANVYSMNQNTADPQNLHMTLSGPTWRRISESYTYDEVGRKRTQTNGNNETTSYKHDAAGHVVETRQPLGTKTTSTYNAFGFQASETDANGRTQTWQTDAYGRVEGHTDLSGVAIKYVYDKAGLLQSLETVSGVHTVGGTTVSAQSQQFKYDQAGQLLELKDLAVGRTTTYRYDAAGNRVLERTEQEVAGKGKLLLQDNYLGYDSQGRLRHIFDGRLNIAIDYDLNGNRKRITTGISVLSGAGAGQETVHDSVRNFAYDAMNRQTVVEEYDEKRGVVRHEISYYLDGNRKGDKFLGNKVVANGGDPIIVTYSTESGEATYNTTTPITYERFEGMVDEQYRYDNLGRLMSVIRDGTQVDLRRYDGAGRALQTGSPGNLPNEYTAKLNEGIPASEQIGAEMRLSNYDKNGRLVFQNTLGGDGGLRMGMDYIDRGDGTGTGYDAAGNVKGFRIHQPGAGVSETQRFTQGLFDGYVVASETATDKNGGNATTSRIEYDANGHQKRIVDEGKTANNRDVYSDTAGRALLVDQGGKLQRQLIVNGEVLGSYGIGLDDLKPKDKDKNPVFAPHVDFEWGYQQINGNYPGASPGAYTVRQGDTLQGIARGAYGDSRMWYRIAEVNGISSDSDLKVGQTLVIPAGVNGVHNTSDTFQPYDPSKVIGDTSPTLPVPAAKGGCGAVGMIIMIVVAVVVTVFTAGAAAAWLASAAPTVFAGTAATIGGIGVSAAGAVAAGAIGAAAGSIVSQAVGVATGVQEKFSWKQVAISAISGGVTYGLGATGGVLSGSSTGAVIARAAVGNALTQGISVAVGLQDKFSWRNVAASAVGAGVGAAVGDAIGDKLGSGDFGMFANRAVSSLAAGAAAGAVRGNGMTVRQVAQDAFGNALGNGIVDAMSPQNMAQESFRQSEIRDQNTEAARYQGQGLFSGSSVRLGNSGSGGVRLGTGDAGGSLVSDDDLPPLDNTPLPRTADGRVILPSGRAIRDASYVGLGGGTGATPVAAAAQREYSGHFPGTQLIESRLRAYTPNGMTKVDGSPVTYSFDERTGQAYWNLGVPNELSEIRAPYRVPTMDEARRAPGNAFSLLTQTDEILKEFMLLGVGGGLGAAVAVPALGLAARGVMGFAADVSGMGLRGAYYANSLGINALGLEAAGLTLGYDAVSPSPVLLGNAGSRALSRGEELRQRYGHLSGDQRRAIIWERTEEIARYQLEAMEASTPGAHFMARHSPQVDLYDQLVSAATGLRPDGKIMGGWNKRFTVDSTQFLSNKDMLYGISRAERIQQYAISTGNPINDYISFRFDYSVGEGFVKNTPMFGADLTNFYRQTKFANFGVDSTTGRAITAFPVLSNKSLGTLY